MNTMEHYMPNADKGVPFYFYVQDIYALDAVRSDGTFWPRSTPQHHRPDSNSGCLFYFDGFRTKRASGLPPRHVVYQNCSMYYGSGRFHIDVAYQKPGNTLDLTNEAARLGIQGPEIGWRPLSFMKGFFDRPGWTASNGGISHASIRGPHDTLLRYNENHAWSSALIPQVYQGPPTRDPSQPAGLTGDLSLVIGLLAMSIPRSEVLTHLSGLIVHGPDGPQWHTNPFVGRGCT
ncbi:uncharacterized protein K489DRAFT_224063 [Dissoconium aciculare CBS 342.82]|uniref:Uncharacterized protein n=1 Tax=Dissoconium aciculare CBS 342.82 TaxID=1314786 RepID=A0A6J3M5A6_9PEZI|nr:uncharacterized protein K489DRAFT_224063 [Dissoconium aciculare CBS 342.82]KAF1823058.1 hypothetical protein K489DRAFT_224063 [Dissoconium aciculare CBS 342.82]